MKLFFSIILALVPGLFWTWYYLRVDKRRPEPLRLIAKVFFWGALATIPAIAIEFAVDFFTNYSSSLNLGVIAVSTLFVIAPVEELLKYFVIKEIIVRNPEFDEPLDAIIYAIVAALGFATFENILVATTGGQEAIVLRFATATLLHAIASGIVGYHLAVYTFGKETERKGVVAQGILIAIVIHALYNIIASTDTPFTMPLIAVLLITMFVLLSKGMKEIRKLGAKKRPPEELSTG